MYYEEIAEGEKATNHYASKAETVSPLEGAIMEARNVAQDNRNQVRKLLQRLRPVLTDAYPEVDKDKAETKPGRVNHAAAIQEHIGFMKETHSILSHILNNLEV